MASDTDRATPGVLRVLTLNLGLVEKRIARGWHLSFSPHAAERAAAIPGLLRGEPSDIIALQEVFSDRHRTIVREAMRATHPYAFVSHERRSVFGDGLMVLSRYPILAGRFVGKRHSRTMRNWAWTRMCEEGCLAVEIDTPQAGTIHVLNVHLVGEHAPAHALERGAGRRDFSGVDHLLAVATSLGDGPKIIAGDFNCSEVVCPDIYGRILAAGYYDAFAVHAAGADQAPFATAATGAAGAEANVPAPLQVTWDARNPLNASGPFRLCPSQRIDHVMVSANAPLAITPVSSAIVYSEPVATAPGGQAITVSDHYGLRVALAFETARGDAKPGALPPVDLREAALPLSDLHVPMVAGPT